MRAGWLLAYVSFLSSIAHASESAWVRTHVFAYSRTRAHAYIAVGYIYLFMYVCCI